MSSVKIEFKKSEYLSDDNELVVWKKAQKINSPHACLVKLSIPHGTMVYFGTQQRHGHAKCRASQVRVIGFYGMNGKRLSNNTIATSERDRNFRYEINTIVRPKRQFSSNYNTCSSGIHFFLLQSVAKTW